MRVEPFKIAIGKQDLDDLQDRLGRVRWADDFGNADWRYGVERHWLKDITKYWHKEFDWRTQEAELNRYPQFKATVEGVHLHFVHLRRGRRDSMPLLLLHGWPWTFVDFLPLSWEISGQVDPSDNFDIVILSLPGFGFSMPLTATGLTVPRLADLFATFMTEVLDYPRFGVAGGDWGAIIALQLAHAHADKVIGVFTSIPAFPGLDVNSVTPDRFAPDEQWMVERMSEARAMKVSHLTVQSHDPQTLAYALVDSPVGTAAWLWERRRAWSDCQGDLLSAFDRDSLCTLASIYWLNRSIGTSLRIYWERQHGSPVSPLHDRLPVIGVPAGFAIHPKEVVLLPRSLVEAGTNLQRWTVMPRGGHFGFVEEPVAIAQELRAFFEPLHHHAPS